MGSTTLGISVSGAAKRQLEEEQVGKISDHMPTASGMWDLPQWELILIGRTEDQAIRVFLKWTHKFHMQHKGKL